MDKFAEQEEATVVLPEAEKKETISYKIIIIVYVLLGIFGAVTGFLLNKGSATSADNKPKMIKTEKTEGSTDSKTFKDSAIGVIEKGGVNGEGTHKLIREGGVSQTAFLISSVIDLDEYVGKKVKVWGETFAAEKAAWLMDVGKIELQ